MAARASAHAFGMWKVGGEHDRAGRGLGEDRSDGVGVQRAEAELAGEELARQ